MKTIPTQMGFAQFGQQAIKEKASDQAEKRRADAVIDARRNHLGQERMTLSFRVSRPDWEQLMKLTMEERTKVQRYVCHLIAADFARRGLPFGTPE